MAEITDIATNNNTG